MAAQKKKTKAKAAWERGYNGHVLWLGKQKLGKVTRAGQGRYTWEAAGKAGAADSLGKARKAVEYSVVMADRQLDLFS